jgi:signal transduction histidine kinase
MRKGLGSDLNPRDDQMETGNLSMPGNGVDLRELTIHGCLFELVDEMLGQVDIVNVLLKATEVVRQVFDADRATIYLVRKDTHELVSATVIGNVSRTIRVPIREDSLAGYCALTGRSFAIPDAYGDLSGIDPRLRFDKSWDELNQFRTRDVVCAPAVFKDEVMGVVQVINSRGNTFNQADLVPLESVARFAAYALYHARLYEELATLKALDREKAEFMRILVHELRSPVTASKMLATSLLRYGNLEDEQTVSVLTRIQGRMEHLLSLVEDILQLSRIKAGGPLSDVVVCDLAAETQAGSESYRQDAEAKGLSMSIEVPTSPVHVRIDLKGYQLVLSNLVSNAVKYTSAGSVAVAIREKHPWAVLTVKDTGIGIPEDDLPRLFTEFFRASNVRQSQIAGTGVGLAGVKQLVERFGGELELASIESKGSVFTVRLPLFEPNTLAGF